MVDLQRYQAAGKSPPEWKPLRIEHPDRPEPNKPKPLTLAEGLGQLLKHTGG